jgi:uncharacterized membrane protein
VQEQFIGDLFSSFSTENARAAVATYKPLLQHTRGGPKMTGKFGMFRWFLDEWPKLREAGVIDSDTEENLQQYYRNRLAMAPPPQKYFLMALSIIGSVMIAGGIILLFNYNWDMLTKAARISIAFLPVALGVALSFYTLIAGRSQVWREGAAVLTSTGTAVAIALLSHIYHTGGTLSEFMTLVLLLSLPLVYIFDSITRATLYAIGIFMTLGTWNTSTFLPTAFGLLAGILPFAGWHLLREKSPYRTWMRYLAMGFALFAMIVFGGKYSLGLFLYTVCAVFMLASMRLRDNRERMCRNPWLPASFCLLLVLLAIGTCEGGGIFEIIQHRKTPEGVLYFWLVEGAFLLGFVLLFVRDYLRKQMDFHRLMMLVLLLIALLGTLLEAHDVDQLFMRIVLIAYMGILGVTLLMRGCREVDMLIFNGGLLMCALLIGLRFFDTDIGLLPRAIGFILLGLGFIGANVFFSRKLGRAKSTEVNHAEGR